MYSFIERRSGPSPDPLFNPSWSPGEESSSGERLMILNAGKTAFSAFWCLVSLATHADLIYVGEEQGSRFSVVQADESIQLYAQNGGLVYGLALDRKGIFTSLLRVTTSFTAFFRTEQRVFLRRNHPLVLPMVWLSTMLGFSTSQARDWGL
jgi:hypothetical protein